MSSSVTGLAHPADVAPARPPRRRGSLAGALLVVLLPLILVPLVTFALLIYRQVRADLTDQVTAQLTSLATLKLNQINEWAGTRVDDINGLAHAPDMIELVGRYMDGQADDEAMRARLNLFLINSKAYEGLMLADPGTGRVLVATLQNQFTRFVGDTFLAGTALDQARQGAYMLPISYEQRMQDVRVLVVAPVQGRDQATLAILHAFVRHELLLDIVSPSPGLGVTGRSYVITHDGYELGNYITARAMGDSLGTERARMDHADGSGVYPDQNGREVVGVYRWIPLYQLALLVEQGTQDAYAPLRRFNNLLLAVGLASLAVSSAGVLYFTRRVITGPLRVLTEGVLRLAGGDLTSMVKVNRNDEAGVLGEAFNRMATELRGLYQDLEAKVAARTRQLEAAAEVGRAATSILSTDQLLARTVELIRERFGYYHVSVFLLDESGRWAQLREATGEVGAQLKARGHRLAVGSNSLIGWVTANRKPRIALDVASDEMHFRNELLPGTRSEAALPLHVGEHLIGALDVQSRSLNAFNPTDVEVLQVLADQIAIALENGRLFARQERTAQLEQRVAGLTYKIHRSLTLDAILENTAAELGQAFAARKVVVRLSPAAHAVLGGAEETLPIQSHSSKGSPAPNGGHSEA